MIRHLFGNQFSGGILSETIYRTDRCTQTPATFSAALQQGNTNRYSQIRNQWMKYLTKSRTPRAIARPFLERVAHLLEPRAKAVGPISRPLRAALIKTSFFVSCAPHLDGRTLERTKGASGHNSNLHRFSPRSRSYGGTDGHNGGRGSEVAAVLMLRH